MRQRVCHFQEAGMETVVRGMPLVHPPKPERLNAYGNGWWDSGGKWVGQKDGGMETRGTGRRPRALERL